MESNKLPIFNYCTLEEAAKYIGNGCTVETIWKWWRADAINICKLFLNVPCEIEVKTDGDLDHNFKLGEPVATVGLSFVFAIRPETRKNFYSDIRGNISTYKGYTNGVWRIVKDLPFDYSKGKNYIADTIDDNKFICETNGLPLGFVDYFDDAYGLDDDDYIDIYVNGSHVNKSPFVLSSSQINDIMLFMGEGVHSLSIFDSYAPSVNYEPVEYSDCSNKQIIDELHGNSIKNSNRRIAVIHAAFQILDLYYTELHDEKGELIDSALIEKLKKHWCDVHGENYNIPEDRTLKDIISDIQKRSNETNKIYLKKKSN